MRLTILASFALFTFACDAGMVLEPRDSGGSDGRTTVRDATGDAASLQDSGQRVDASIDVALADTAVASDAIVRGATRAEICGNDFDDDEDGTIDNGCDCAVGTMRACWLGPPEAMGVGACHDGVQHCQSSGAASTWGACENSVMPTREILANGIDDDCDRVTDEPDGICLPTQNTEMGTQCANGLDDDCDTRTDCDDPGCAGTARCPPGCVSRETTCWGEVDEDCDGRIDCADTDCAMDPSCQRGPCPAGQVPTYRQRNLGVSAGASSILPGDGRPVFPMTCEPGTCAIGQVAVVLSGRTPICVPPPPPCMTGTSPNYIASGVWRCDPPCELIIHYGGLYGGRNVCAGRPNISCGSGTVPTFTQETETWQCRPTCNNGAYDRIMLGAMLVCIPC